MVIPALNEAQVLPSLLAQLAQQQALEIQIVVSDGGSSDGTIARAVTAGARTVRVEAGRAVQMNAGARAASAEFILFLHADSQLPHPRLLADALAALRSEIAQRRTHRVAGHFPLRFADASPRHGLFYRYLEGKTRLNRPYTINGDQGLLISRAYFDEIGGFDERLPFMEDQRIAARIFEHGTWIVLPGEIYTAARRFETEGVRERYTMMALIMGLHAGGADDFLAQAPQLYRTPAGRLQLRPHLEAIERYLGGLGFARRWGLLLRVGAFVRDNAWQLCYRRDVLRDDGQLRCLAVHDRWIAPLLRNRAAVVLAAALARLWFRHRCRQAS